MIIKVVTHVSIVSGFVEYELGDDELDNDYNHNHGVTKWDVGGNYKNIWTKQNIPIVWDESGTSRHAILYVGVCNIVCQNKYCLEQNETFCNVCNEVSAKI